MVSKAERSKAAEICREWSHDCADQGDDYSAAIWKKLADALRTLPPGGVIKGRGAQKCLQQAQAMSERKPALPFGIQASHALVYDEGKEQAKELLPILKAAVHPSFH